MYIYRMETSRGCPHNCTYCANNALKKLQYKTVRLKSMEQIKEELNFIKEKFPFVKSIFIEDDCFTVRKDTCQVAEAIKDSGYTFRCLVSPSYATEDKIRCLVENGLIYCFIGLQSRSPDVEIIYNRNRLNQNVDLIFKIFKTRYQNVPLLVDLLIDNPWEKTEDTIYTLRYLLENLPHKVRIGINSLVFYEKTRLWERAKEEGLLESQSYLKTWHWHRQEKIRYTTLLFVVLRYRLPRPIIKLLATKLFILFFEREFFSSHIFPRIVRIAKKMYIIIRKEQPGPSYSRK